MDYRRLKAVTRINACPLPQINDSVDALTGSIFFSNLDLVSRYWQVPLDRDASEKLAFKTRGWLWHWKTLHFGLPWAPFTFERLIKRVLKGLQLLKTHLLYLDDVIAFSAQLLWSYGQKSVTFSMGNLINWVVASHGPYQDPGSQEVVFYILIRTQHCQRDHRFEICWFKLESEPLLQLVSHNLTVKPAALTLTPQVLWSPVLLFLQYDIIYIYNRDCILCVAFVYIA